MRYRVYLLFLFLGVLLAYSSSVAGDFTCEDHYLITGNDFIKDFGNASHLFNVKRFFRPMPIINGARPMTVFSLMADYAVWGENPFGFRITNILLHITNVFLVFALLNTLKVRRELSFLSAFLFGLHPINGEVVNIPGFRGDLLATAFYLGSLLLFFYACRERRYRKPVLFFLLSALFFLMAVMSKEIAATFPALLLVLTAFTGMRYFRQKLKVNLFAVSLFALSAFYILTFWMGRYSYNMFGTFFVSIAGGMRPFDSLVLYFNTIFITFFMYIRNIFAPFFLSYEYQIQIGRITAASAAGFAAAAALLYAAIAAKDRRLKISLLFFIITYLPSTNIIPIHNTLSDRYMYLPLAGGMYALCRLGIFLFRSVIRRPVKVFGIRAGYLAAVCVAVIFHSVSFNRNFVFADILSLYENAERFAPENPRVGYNLGLAYSNNGFPALSNEILQETQAGHPLYASSRIWHIMSRNYFIMGQHEESAKYLVRTARLNPSREVIDELEYILKEGNITSL